MGPADLTLIGMAVALVSGAPAGKPVESCAVSVDFGSYCCGIDDAALAETKAFIAASPRVTRHSVRNWGREGEVTLCLTTRNAADARALYAQLRRRLDGRKGVGPVTVRLGASK
jgi:hypothetical protein